MGSNVFTTPSQSLLKWTLIAAGLTLGPACYLLYYNSSSSSTEDSDNDSTLDEGHSHIKEHCEFKSYSTAIATYPSIRTYYRPHPHKEKLRAIADLPLLVFIHGLGGLLPQFAPLAHSLVNVAPSFGIELPGHGRSLFKPTDYKAYTTEALTDLWKLAIEETCAAHSHTKVVLIGHSMGCSIAALLASDPKFKPDVAGIVAICPKAGPPTPSQSKTFRRFLSLPDSLLDAFRWFDKRGGVDSASVKRFVGDSADIDLKKLQLKYNALFKTPVWKRTAMGAIPTYDRTGEHHGGLPGQAVWSQIRLPLFLIAGEGDQVTPPSEIDTIVSYLQQPTKKIAADPVLNNLIDALPAVPLIPESNRRSSKSDDRDYGTAATVAEKRTHHNMILKTAVLPAPAAHSLLYSHATYRTVAGLVEDFLARYVSEYLSPGWQLQHLTTSGKWDVKNLEKWQKVRPVSGPIHGNLFRALKTLREQDEIHTPTKFAAEWKDKIYAVVDISHETPVYSTHTLEEEGIEYHKFPTVSKIPPTAAEVAGFIALIERLRTEMKAKNEQDKAIGVHCHYGYNRTGFFIAAYLIEKYGYRVDDAVDEFQKAKPPGIKHDHFIDTLHVRYTVGLRRASTSKP